MDKFTKEFIKHQKSGFGGEVVEFLFIRELPLGFYSVVQNMKKTGDWKHLTDTCDISFMYRLVYSYNNYPDALYAIEARDAKIAALEAIIAELRKEVDELDREIGKELGLL